MNPPPDRPGVGSTLIDIVLVFFILGVLGLLLLIAARVVAGALRAVTRLWRKRDGGGQ